MRCYVRRNVHTYVLPLPIFFFHEHSKSAKFQKQSFSYHLHEINKKAVLIYCVVQYFRWSFVKMRFICYFCSLKNSVKSIHQYSTHHSIGKRKIELASYFWMNEKVKFFNNKSQQKPALAQYFDIFRGWFSTRTRSVLRTVENWNLLKNSLQWQQFGNFLSLGTQFSSG